PVDCALARFSVTTRNRFDCASNPEAPILKALCSGSCMELCLRARQQHPMECFGYAGVELECAVDVAGVDQLLFEADRVTGMGSFPGLRLADVDGCLLRGAIGQVRGMGCILREARRFQHLLER